MTAAEASGVVDKAASPRPEPACCDHRCAALIHVDLFVMRSELRSIQLSNDVGAGVREGGRARPVSSITNVPGRTLKKTLPLE